MKEEKFAHPRKPLHWWRWGRVAEGKLWSHREERSNRGAEGKAERFQHRGSVPTSTHQPEWLLCSPANQDWWWLGAEAQASEFRTQGADWGWLCEHSLKGATVTQLAIRESWKESGPA